MAFTHSQRQQDAKNDIGNRKYFHCQQAKCKIAFEERVEEKEYKEIDGFIQADTYANKKGRMLQPVYITFILHGPDKEEKTDNKQNNTLNGKKKRAEMQQGFKKNKID